MEYTGINKAIMDVLADIEEEVYEKEKFIRLHIAVEYMVNLLDENHRQQFKTASDKAKTREDLTYILDLLKRHLGQNALINMLGL